MKLPVATTLVQAALTLRYRPGQCLAAFWPGLICIIGAMLMEKMPFGALTLSVLSWPLVIIGFCAWHRHLIMEQPVRLQLGAAEWLFFKTTMIASIIMLVPFLIATILVATLQVPGAFARIIGMVATVLGLWLATTTLMALPANALGQSPDHEDLKALVAPHQGQIFMVIALPYLAEVPVEALGEWLGAPFETIIELILLPVLPLTVSSLSLAHLWLYANRDRQVEQISPENPLFPVDQSKTSR